MEIAAIVIALIAMFFAYRATTISSRALAISRAARREVLELLPAEPETEPENEPAARFSVAVEPGSNQDVANDGTIWGVGHDVLAKLIVTVTNDGDRESGRTEVGVWVPHAEGGVPWWAGEDGEAPIADVPQAVADENVQLSLRSDAPTYESVHLSRVLDGVPIGIPERLAICAHFDVNPGRNEFPVDVVVRGEDTGEELKHRAVVRIARRY